MHAWVTTLTVGLLATATAAAPSVDAGTHYLLPNRADQQTTLTVQSDPAVDVQGLELYMQIGDGSGAAGPVFQAADVRNGTIFDGNNPGLFAGSYVQPGRLYQGLVTSSGTVAADGLLATLTISTVGRGDGTLELFLHNDLESAATNFAGVPAALTSGALIVPPMTGDADLDGDVDETDLGRLQDHFGTAGGAEWTEGDFNGDGAVDDLDLSLLLSRFGQSAAGDVPAPSSLALLLAVVPALAPRARRRA